MHVLLDLDGTLTDPAPGILGCIRYALEGLGRDAPPDAALLRYIGPPLQEGLAELLATEDVELVSRAIGLYRERYSSLGMFECSVYPGIQEALVELHGQGAKLYLATSKPHVFAEAILRHFGLRDFFRAAYGSELDGTRANKAELIAHLLAEESIPPAEARMVGDRSHDMIGAIANRVAPIGVLWGFGSRAELLRSGAVALCERPERLGETLQQLAVTMPQAPPVAGP